MYDYKVIAVNTVDKSITRIFPEKKFLVMMAVVRKVFAMLAPVVPGKSILGEPQLAHVALNPPMSCNPSLSITFSLNKLLVI